MAREVRNFQVSVPAGTAQATPQVTNLPLGSRIVRKVRVRVPPGPSGLMGWALGSAGVRVLPWGANEWMVMDNEFIDWDLEGQIDSGAWQLQAYNTGAYAHTVYVTFQLDPVLGRTPGGVIVPISAAALAPSAGYAPSASGPPPESDASGGGEAPGPAPVEPPLPEEPPAPEPGPVLPPPAADDGYAMARINAVHAVQAALGATITTPGVLPPAPGSLPRLAYDAGREAAIAALELV